MLLAAELKMRVREKGLVAYIYIYVEKGLVAVSQL